MTAATGAKSGRPIPPSTERDGKRFWSYIGMAEWNGCLLWRGCIDPGGYGLFGIGGKTRKAHRVAYTWARGPIPEGFTVDHLCRSRGCVNVSHLEAVPHKVNVLRGNGPTAVNARKTACENGHPIRRPYKTTSRGCRECLREMAQANGYGWSKSIPRCVSNVSAIA